MKVILNTAFLLGLFAFRQASEVPQAGPEVRALSQIAAEKNLEAKKKLVVNFEKSFPKSDRLPEVFTDLSRALVSSGDYTLGKQYAEKGVAAVAKMKSEAANGSPDPKRQTWLDAMIASANKNLAWVNQMIAWREQQVRATVLRKQ